MPTTSVGRKPKKRRRSSTAAVTRKATSAALRRIIADQFEGNFGALAKAISGGKDDRSVRAKVWRAQSEKRPSVLDADLAESIAHVARPKGKMAKRAYKLICRVAASEPVTETTAAKPRTKKSPLSSDIGIRVHNGMLYVTAVAAPDLVKRRGESFFLQVPIDSETALEVLLPK